MSASPWLRAEIEKLARASEADVERTRSQRLMMTSEYHYGRADAFRAVLAMISSNDPDHPIMPEIADRSCTFKRPADEIEGDMA